MGITPKVHVLKGVAIQKNMSNQIGKNIATTAAVLSNEWLYRCDSSDHYISELI